MGVRQTSQAKAGSWIPRSQSLILTASQGVANPVATFLSVAMMLRYSFGLAKEATAIEKAVEKVLDSKNIGGLEIRTK